MMTPAKKRKIRIVVSQNEMRCPAKNDIIYLHSKCYISDSEPMNVLKSTCHLVCTLLVDNACIMSIQYCDVIIFILLFGAVETLISSVLLRLNILISTEVIKYSTRWASPVVQNKNARAIDCHSTMIIM